MARRRGRRHRSAIGGVGSHGRVARPGAVASSAATARSATARARVLTRSRVAWATAGARGIAVRPHRTGQMHSLRSRHARNQDEGKVRLGVIDSLDCRSADAEFLGITPARSHCGVPSRVWRRCGQSDWRKRTHLLFLETLLGHVFRGGRALIDCG